MSSDKTVRDAYLDTVLNQLETGDPPETKVTYDRLVAEGHPRNHALQLIAAALPETPLSPAQVRAIVDACGPLVVPRAIRTLAPGEPAYRGTYLGAQRERDAAYHQGTAWAWLLGSYALAHLRAYGDPRAAMELLVPLEQHVREAGIGTVSEIFDGDPPNQPRGCIAQAWSVGEALRAYRAILKRAQQ